MSLVPDLEGSDGEEHSNCVEASWVGEAAAARLVSGRMPGRVQGVYRGAINAICPGGMVSFVPERLERGPINVNLKLDDRMSLSTFKVRSGDILRRTDDHASLDIGEGRMIVSLRWAHVHFPQKSFQRPVLGARGLRKNLEAARETALTFGNHRGLGELIALTGGKGIGPSGEPLNMFAAEALPRVQALLRSISDTNREKIKKAARQLAGLGPGLTPSSDDMLSGLMLVMYLHARNARTDEERAEAISWAILSGARGRTTLLSLEHISQAVQGNGNERVMRLCRELLTGNPESVEREVQRVVLVGETSGTDTVLGLLLGIQLLINGGKVEW